MTEMTVPVLARDDSNLSARLAILKHNSLVRQMRDENEQRRAARAAHEIAIKRAMAAALDEVISCLRTLVAYSSLTFSSSL